VEKAEGQLERSADETSNTEAEREWSGQAVDRLTTPAILSGTFRQRRLEDSNAKTVFAD